MSMKKNSLLRSIFEDLFNKDPFEDLFRMVHGQDLSEKNLDREVMEFTKGKYKSRITVLFDKEGYPVGQRTETEYIPTEDEKNQNQLQLLQHQLEEAKGLEDYGKCAELKKQIDALKVPKAQLETKTNRN